MAMNGQLVAHPQSGTFAKCSPATAPPSLDEAEGRILASPLPMWVFDPRTSAIVGANHPAARLYGYSQEELLRCRARDLWPRQRCDGSGGGTRLPSAGVGDSPWIGAFEQRRKDGTTFEADIAMIETGNEEHCAVMVIAKAATNPRTR